MFESDRMDFITKLFDTSDFPDRWHCGTWTSLHGWIHVISDTLTWAAYTAIPIVLGVLIMRRKDLFFPRIFWLFSAFILACGTVHLVEAIIFWFPIYRVSAIFKMCTAVVSCATVVALIRVMPSALELPGLAGINEELRKEVAAREAAEQRLKLVLDNMSEVVMFANTEGRFEFWNDAAKDLCGVPKISQPKSGRFTTRPMTPRTKVWSRNKNSRSSEPLAASQSIAVSLSFGFRIRLMWFT